MVNAGDRLIRGSKMATFDDSPTRCCSNGSDWIRLVPSFGLHSVSMVSEWCVWVIEKSSSLIWWLQPFDFEIANFNFVIYDRPNLSLCVQWVRTFCRLFIRALFNWDSIRRFSLLSLYLLFAFSSHSFLPTLLHAKSSRAWPHTKRPGSSNVVEANCWLNAIAIRLCPVRTGWALNGALRSLSVT